MSCYKIYIIDDDLTTYDVLKEYLTMAGFEITTATDGRAGLEMILKSPPDLILLDVQMPEMDGFQLLDALRKNNGIEDIPVLFITSLNRTNLKVKGLELGAEDYITKPFERAELFARIKGALRRSSRYQRLENVVSGNLADLGMAELIQTLDIGRKTAQIKLPDIFGEIFVDKGFFTYIQQGSFLAEEALQRLLFLEKGTFTLSFGLSPRNITSEPLNIQHQLLSCSAYLDEVRFALSGLQEPNPVIESFSSARIPVTLGQFAKLLPLHLYDLLAMMPGDLLINAKALMQEITQGANHNTAT